MKKLIFLSLLLSATLLFISCQGDTNTQSEVTTGNEETVAETVTTAEATSVEETLAETVTTAEATSVEETVAETVTTTEVTSGEETLAETVTTAEATSVEETVAETETTTPETTAELATTSEATSNKETVVEIVTTAEVTSNEETIVETVTTTETTVDETATTSVTIETEFEDKTTEYTSEIITDNVPVDTYKPTVELIAYSWDEFIKEINNYSNINQDFSNDVNRYNILTGAIELSGCNVTTLLYSEYELEKMSTQSDWNFDLYWNEIESDYEIRCHIFYIPDGVDVSGATYGYRIYDNAHQIYTKDINNGKTSYVCLINDNMFMRMVVKNECNNFEIIVNQLLEYSLKIKNLVNGTEETPPIEKPDSNESPKTDEYTTDAIEETTETTVYEETTVETVTTEEATSEEETVGETVTSTQDKIDQPSIDDFPLLTIISEEEYTKLLNSVDMPTDFVSYNKIEVIGDFDSVVFLSNAYANDYSSYMYTLVDSEGFEIILYVDHNDEILPTTSTVSKADNTNMRLLSDMSKGVYVFDNITYKYVSGRLLAISWKAQNVNYTLCMLGKVWLSDYPLVESTFVGKILNANIASQTINEVFGEA